MRHSGRSVVVAILFLVGWPSYLLSGANATVYSYSHGSSSGGQARLVNGHAEPMSLKRRPLSITPIAYSNEDRATEISKEGGYEVDGTFKCAVTPENLFFLRGGAISISTTATATTTTTTTTTHAALRTIQVLGYFALWYVLNIWYNIVNKHVLNAVGMPVSVAVAQLGIGSLWVGLQWAVGLRRGPAKLTADGLARIAPVALFHGGGQLATVLSLGAGAVSFTHVVKAMEPFFSALVAAVCFGQVFRPQVYVSLLPVVSGVSLACLKEINFSLLSFVAAMTSNLMFACRANFSKALMTRPPTEDGASISSANLYGLVTIAAFTVFSPVAILTGYRAWRSAWDTATQAGKGQALAISIFFSGISHYLNNEVMYLALGAVHPTTLAVGNTFKRVFIIAASLVVFKTPISRLGMLGSAIAVGGVLVYSLTKQHYDSLDRMQIAEDAKNNNAGHRDEQQQ